MDLAGGKKRIGCNAKSATCSANGSAYVKRRKIVISACEQDEYAKKPASLACILY